MQISEKNKMPMRHLFAGAVSILVLFFAFWELDAQYILARLLEFSVATLVLVIVLIAANFLVVTFRMVCITRAMGHHLHFATGVLANIYGLFVGLFVLSFVGSTIGRNYVLVRSGLDMASTSLVVGYERLLMAAVSASLAIICALLIFDTAWLYDFLGQYSLAVMLPALICTAILNIISQNSKNEGGANFFSLHGVAWRSFFGVTCVTTLAIIFNSFTFVFLLMDLVPSVHFWLAVAASLVVAFAASLPFTINGWGVRELSAIYAFGAIGVDRVDALAVSITVGFLNYIFILLAYFSTHFLRKRFVKYMNNNSRDNGVSFDFGKSDSFDKSLYPLVSLFAFLVGTFIFYSFSVSVGDSVVTFNLSDPIVLLALGYLISHVIFMRHLPFHLSSGVGQWIFAVSICICVALYLGWMRHGFIEWAFVNRGLGWIVLMGYFGFGAMVASILGATGVQMLLKYLVMAACVILFFALSHNFLYETGVLDILPPGNFEGFSGNRNAYAFQMLIIAGVAALSLSCSANSPAGWGVATVAALLFAVLLSNSVTGIVGVFVLTILFILRLGAGERRWALLAVLIAVLVRFLVPEIFDSVTHDLQIINRVSEPVAGYRVANGVEFMEPVRLNQSSLSERFQSWLWGINMWWEHPIFGGGLGAFVHTSESFGDPIVVHSTYIWVLAEFGIFGFIIIIAVPFIYFGRLFLKDSVGNKNEGRSRVWNLDALMVLVLVFSVFSITHDVAYQRLFWLLAGAYLVNLERRHSVSH